jgi:predicted nucleic acid-binding protein
LIIPDVNLLVYAYNADAPFHLPAKRWWEGVNGLSGLP